MKAKPVYLVTLVFVIGFILGMLTSAQIRNKRLKPVRMVLSEQRYVDDLCRIIEPTENQIAVFNDLINKYGELNGELNKNFWDGINSNMEEFRKEIDSNLTKEQKDKLKEFEDERERRFEEFMRNRDDSTRYRSNRQEFDRNSDGFRDTSQSFNGRDRYERGPRGNEDSFPYHNDEMPVSPPPPAPPME
jgi:polyhydroxyalkanoate synthesis regulator phasin